MEISTLIADPAALRLDCIRPFQSVITLVVRTTVAHAECPRCHRASSRVHSRYTRRIADLPWHE